MVPGSAGGSWCCPPHAAPRREAVRAGTAPAAIVLGEPDLILALGAAVAEELYGVQIPILVLPAADLAAIRDGATVDIGSGGVSAV
ncbi:MAG: hypothetical protein WEI16_04540 [Chloroflexota bacterium]